MNKKVALFGVIILCFAFCQLVFSQEQETNPVKPQEQQQDTLKGMITFTKDGKGFIKDGETFTFGEDYANLEKAVRKSSRARQQIDKARGNMRTATIFAGIAGGMSGSGLGIYLAEPSDETKQACLIFQGACVGCFGIALIPMQAIRKNIEKAVKYYNEDLRSGKIKP
jgi:hypothetical protein